MGSIPGMLVLIVIPGGIDIIAELCGIGAGTPGDMVSFGDALMLMLIVMLMVIPLDILGITDPFPADSFGMPDSFETTELSIVIEAPELAGAEVLAVAVADAILIVMVIMDDIFGMPGSLPVGIIDSLGMPGSLLDSFGIMDSLAEADSFGALDSLGIPDSLGAPDDVGAVGAPGAPEAVGAPGALGAPGPASPGTGAIGLAGRGLPSKAMTMNFVESSWYFVPGLS